MKNMDQKDTEQKKTGTRPEKLHGETPAPLVEVDGGSAKIFEEIRKKLEMAEAMKELFDEDKVEHHHGSAEPEGD